MAKNNKRLKEIGFIWPQLVLSLIFEIMSKSFRVLINKTYFYYKIRN